MTKYNQTFKESFTTQKTIPILGSAVLIIVNLFVILIYFPNPIYWLALIKEIQNFLQIISYKQFKQKIINSEAFNLKVKSFLEIFLIFALGLFLWALYSKFIVLTEVTNWQFLLAAGLLNSGIKIFLGVNSTKEGFHSGILWDNFLWILTVLVALALVLIPTLDYYASFLITLFLLVQSIQKFNHNINTFQPPIKTIEVPVNIEVEQKQVQNLNKPQIEVFDISDEIVDRLKKIDKVKNIHNTLVCKIKENQEVVTLTLVVDNNSNQEDIFNTKKKAKKMLKRLDFMRSVVEIEYEAEYKGIV